MEGKELPADRPMTFVSGIWSELIYPIATLAERLALIPYSQPNQVLPAPLENGYSNAIIVLAVIIIESVIGKIQFLLQSSPVKSVLEFTRQEFPDYEGTDRLEELFVIRDVIVHNHLWETEVDPDEMTFMSKRLLGGYGDKKLNKVLDEETMTSRRLHLNLFPTRINRVDVIRALDQMTHFLLFLRSKDPNYVFLSERLVKFGNDLVPFTEISQRLMSTIPRDRAL